MANVQSYCMMEHGKEQFRPAGINVLAEATDCSSVR